MQRLRWRRGAAKFFMVGVSLNVLNFHLLVPNK
jgi:hypothetical protein